MRPVTRARSLALALVVAAACARPAGKPALEPAGTLAPGIDWYRTADSSLVEDAGPIAVYLLRLDPARAQLVSVLSNDEVAGSETVESIAVRHRAVAAINGGFFNRENGEPFGLLKVSGRLVSDANAMKGAVVIHTPASAPMNLVFDQISAKVDLGFEADHRTWTVPIAGVDTTRARGKLMLYTPSYHADTDTAPTGTEWILDGEPLHVTEVRHASGHTPIPKTGAVLSYGGTQLPEALAMLSVGTEVGFTTRWQSRGGSAPALLESADHIVNGAGLLRRDGEVRTDWHDENLPSELLVNTRHPRTLIGRDRQGFIWLAAVDGRQPGYSIGMTFSDLQRLCDRLELRDALNLDGGGSTTMVVQGRIVNRPSDPGGARPVSDALLVTTK